MLSKYDGWRKYLDYYEIENNDCVQCYLNVHENDFACYYVETYNIN